MVGKLLHQQKSTALAPSAVLSKSTRPIRLTSISIDKKENSSQTRTYCIKHLRQHPHYLPHELCLPCCWIQVIHKTITITWKKKYDKYKFETNQLVRITWQYHCLCSIGIFINFILCFCNEISHLINLLDKFPHRVYIVSTQSDHYVMSFPHLA